MSEPYYSALSCSKDPNRRLIDSGTAELQAKESPLIAFSKYGHREPHEEELQSYSSTHTPPKLLQPKGRAMGTYAELLHEELVEKLEFQKSFSCLCLEFCALRF